MPHDAGGWPMFFCKRPLRARNLTIRAGEAFPIQDIRVIRGYGSAFGLKDADTRPLPELDYVEVLDVRDRQMQRHVLQQGLTAKTVKSLMRGEGDAT